MTQVDAIVLAGGKPQPGELLFPYTQGQPKALLEIAGRPMLDWILEALDQAATIRRIAVVGLAAPRPEASRRPARVFVADQGSLMGNAQAGAAELAKTGPLTAHILLVSSDIPTLTAEIVDWIVTTSLETDHEGYYSLIPREKMETRFPASRRSYFYFKDGVFTGSDINLLAADLILHGHARAPALIEARKSIFRQARLIGFDVLLRFALRQLTVAEAARLVSQRLHIKGRALICPYAEAGMDVDKPGQYELVKRDLEARVKLGAA
jgi:molybdopterin-guanine dinucleotide biosynthesis protein A